MDAERRQARPPHEHLGYILAEMQFLQRAYPGAEW
jgi:1,2-phenylacetyl-CoA epoxidase catalytic subunit